MFRLTAAVLALSLAAAPAQAEGRIRIAEQFGVVYLLLNVAQDQQLIEKQGKKLGVDITVERLQLSGGSAVNDARCRALSISPAPASVRC
jgi:NitT/TauT family transport system substrate-binding protein